jgi:flagellar biosynthetic protein FlhB
MSEDDDDKQHDPSQRRLDEARQRGEIPRSADITAAASYAGLMISFLVAGANVVQETGQAGIVILDQANLLASRMSESGKAPLADMFVAFAMAALPLLLLPIVAVVLALIAQGSFVFASEKLMPKLSRISPQSIAGQKFGREGLFEFAKSSAKMLAVGVILAWHLSKRAQDIAASVYLQPAESMTLMLGMMVEFLFLTVLLSTGFGALDYLWQKAQHIRKNRMSRKDLMDEMKDSEGDPHVKAQRRQRGQQIAMNRMLQDVASADVIIVNPTHYAVALRWKRSDRTAPVCVAKGMDEIAARIREKAAIAGVQLYSDPPTARALFGSVEIGQQIRPEHYKPVAAAIRFAEALRKRSKARK